MRKVKKTQDGDKTPPSRWLADAVAIGDINWVRTFIQAGIIPKPGELGNGFKRYLEDFSGQEFKSVYSEVKKHFPDKIHDKELLDIIASPDTKRASNLKTIINSRIKLFSEFISDPKWLNSLTELVCNAVVNTASMIKKESYQNLRNELEDLKIPETTQLAIFQIICVNLATNTFNRYNEAFNFLSHNLLQTLQFVQESYQVSAKAFLSLDLSSVSKLDAYSDVQKLRYNVKVNLNRQKLPEPDANHSIADELLTTLLACAVTSKTTAFAQTAHLVRCIDLPVESLASKLNYLRLWLTSDAPITASEVFEDLEMTKISEFKNLVSILLVSQGYLNAYQNTCEIDTRVKSIKTALNTPGLKIVSDTIEAVHHKYGFSVIASDSYTLNPDFKRILSVSFLDSMYAALTPTVENDLISIDKVMYYSKALDILQYCNSASASQIITNGCILKANSTQTLRLSVETMEEIDTTKHTETIYLISDRIKKRLKNMEPEIAAYLTHGIETLKAVTGLTKLCLDCPDLVSSLPFSEMINLVAEKQKLTSSQVLKL